MGIVKNIVSAFACAVSPIALAEVSPDAFETCRFVDEDVSYEFSQKYAGELMDESFMVEQGPGWRIEHFAPKQALIDLKAWLAKSAAGLWQSGKESPIYLECSSGDGKSAYISSSDGNEQLMRDLKAFFNSYTMSERPVFKRTYSSFHGGGPEERLRFERPEIVDERYEFYRYMFRYSREHRSSIDDKIAKNRYLDQKDRQKQDPEMYKTGGSYVGSNSFIGRIPGETKMTVVMTGGTMREVLYLDCRVTVHEDYTITCECSGDWHDQNGRPIGMNR